MGLLSGLNYIKMCFFWWLARDDEIPIIVAIWTLHGTASGFHGSSERTLDRAPWDTRRLSEWHHTLLYTIEISPTNTQPMSHQTATFQPLKRNYVWVPFVPRAFFPEFGRSPCNSSIAVSVGFVTIKTPYHFSHEIKCVMPRHPWGETVDPPTFITYS